MQGNPVFTVGKIFASLEGLEPGLARSVARPVLNPLTYRAPTKDKETDTQQRYSNKHTDRDTHDQRKLVSAIRS